MIFFYLKDAEWKWQWVGLRPSRNRIRVERDFKKFKNGQLEVNWILFDIYRCTDSTLIKFRWCITMVMAGME